VNGKRAKEARKFLASLGQRVDELGVQGTKSPRQVSNAAKHLVKQAAAVKGKRNA